MRFLRNDKFAGKVVANCGEFQFQKSIYVTTNLLRLFALLGSQILNFKFFKPQIFTNWHKSEIFKFFNL
jgi:hypothetical protein